MLAGAGADAASQEAFTRLQALRQEVQALSEKVSELEMEADEHRLVLAALLPLAPTRKCHRRVGGVLVECTVSTTVPLLQTNLQGVSLGTPVVCIFCRLKGRWLVCGRSGAERTPSWRDWRRVAGFDWDKAPAAHSEAGRKYWLVSSLQARL